MLNKHLFLSLLMAVSTASRRRYFGSHRLCIQTGQKQSCLGRTHCQKTESGRIRNVEKLEYPSPTA